MSFSQAGVDLLLQRNPATGKFDLVRDVAGPNVGNPRPDDTRVHAVLTTLVSRKRGQRPGVAAQGGGYYGDNQNRRGTLLWTVTQDVRATGSQLQAFAEDGGQQLVELRMLQGFVARPTKLAPGKWRIDCAWSLPNGTTGGIVL